MLVIVMSGGTFELPFAIFKEIRRSPSSRGEQELPVPRNAFALAAVAIVRERPVYFGIFALGLSGLMFVAVGVAA